MPSAPEEKTHGWVGWKATSSTPRSRVSVCPLRTFTGTSSGFCNRSLWEEREAQDRAARSPGGQRGQYLLIHHPVAHDDTAVVRARGKEWVAGMEGHSPQGLLVVPGESVPIQGRVGGGEAHGAARHTAGASPEHSVGLGRKVQVKPHQLTVIATTDEVVTWGQMGWWAPGSLARWLQP